MNPASCAAHGAGAVDACIVSGAMRSGNRQNAPSGEFPDSVLQLPEFGTDRAMCRNRWRTAGKAACPRSRAELKAQPPPAEPAVYTQREGTPDASWKYLLQNQPHDSIYGCSVDQVHIDMRYRYDQTMEIGAELLSRSMDWLLKKEEPGKKWTAISQVDTKNKPHRRIARHYAALLRISNGVRPFFISMRW